MLTKDLIKKLRTGLTSFIASALAVALMGVAVPVCADNTGTAPKVIILDHDGNPGYWFPREKAIELQKDVEELRVVRSQIKLLDQQLAIKVERIDLLKEIAATNEKAATIATNNLEKAVKLRREAEEDRDSFFAGKPWFWLGIGAITGIIASVVLATQLKD
jgi:ElaB/YqjD/DUF883 family membrane-anchored ribosome-binding protein